MGQQQKLLIANFDPVLQMARPADFRQLLGAIAQRLEVEPDWTFVIGLNDDHQSNSTITSSNTSNIKMESASANKRADYTLTSASYLPQTPLANLTAGAETTPKKMVEAGVAFHSSFCSAITLTKVDKLGFSPIIDLSSSTTATSHSNSCPDYNQRTQGWLNAVGLVPPHLDIYYDFERELDKGKEANTAEEESYVLDHTGIALTPTARQMQEWQDSGPVVIIPPPDPVLALFLGHAITHYLAFDVYESLYIVTAVQPLTLTEWD